MMKRVATVFLLAFALAVDLTNACAETVSSKGIHVEFSQSHPRFDAKTGRFVMDGVLHNTAVTAVDAPIALVIGGFIPKQSSIALLKPDGFVPDGSAYQLILKQGKLGVGAKIPFTLRFGFSNPVDKLCVSVLEALAKKAFQFKSPALANFQFQYRVVQMPATNRTPVANAGTDKVGTLGAMARLDGSASSDKDSDPLKYVWTLMPAPGSKAKLSRLTTATTDFKPDIAGGYIARLTVSDGYVQSLADTVKITAKANSGINHSPVISSYAPDSGTATRGFTYAVIATDADKDKLTYSLDVSPSGMSISTGGIINWTVANKPHARIPVTVKVTDGRGGKVLQSFSIHIQPCTCK